MTKFLDSLEYPDQNHAAAKVCLGYLALAKGIRKPQRYLLGYTVTGEKRRSYWFYLDTAKDHGILEMEVRLVDDRWVRFNADFIGLPGDITDYLGDDFDLADYQEWLHNRPATAPQPALPSTATNPGVPTVIFSGGS